MSTLLQDTFTDTTGTALTAHTMTVGAGWSNVENTHWSVNTNKASNGTDGPGTVVADAGAADATAAADLEMATGLSGSDQVCLAFRESDSANYWMAGIFIGSAAFQLYKKVAGSFTQVGSTAFTIAANTAYTCQVVLSGSSISATLAGGNTLATTDSFNSTATKFGFRCACNSGAAMRADNFLVTSGGGSATATPGAGTVAVSGVAPTASGSGTATATPGAAAVAASGVAPTAAGSGTATAAAGAASVAAAAADISAAGSGTATATPGAAAVAASGVAPTPAGSGTAAATPGAAEAAATGADVTATAAAATAVPGVAALAALAIDLTAAGSGTATATPGAAAVAAGVQTVNAGAGVGGGGGALQDNNNRV